MRSIFRATAQGATLFFVVWIGGCEGPTEPSPICTLALEPRASSFGHDGGGGAFTVDTSLASCPWVAVASASWITVTSGSTGDGDGAVGYVVASNTAAATRSASIAVGSAGHVVSQAGKPPVTCGYRVHPSSASVDATGSEGQFAVDAPAACPWAAISTATWLVVTAGARGDGPGTVSYRAEPNTNMANRSATIDVETAMFVVTQAGQPPLSCDYTVAPVAFTPCMAGGTLLAKLQTASGCQWTASTNVPWLTLRGASGRGSADVTIDYLDNYDAPRQGLVFVRWPTVTAGQNIRVDQAGCSYAVGRSTISIPAAGDSSSFLVYQQSDPTNCGGPLQDQCRWAATSDVPWILVTTSMPRAGDDRVEFTVAPNPSPVARSGMITVRDKQVRVVQAGV